MSSAQLELVSTSPNPTSIQSVHSYARKIENGNEWGKKFFPKIEGKREDEQTHARTYELVPPAPSCVVYTRRDLPKWLAI